MITAVSRAPSKLVRTSSVGDRVSALATALSKASA